MASQANPPVASGKYVCLSFILPALGTAKSVFACSPVTGTIKRITLAANAVVDGTNAISSKIAGTAITGGTDSLTTSNFGTAGQTRVIVPTAANDVRAGQNIELITDGGGTVGEAQVCVLIEQE